MGLSIFGTNATAHATWVASPQGRGTWDILSTCIITLGLCVFSAIHLNIPDPKWGFWTKAGMKTKWLLIALLAPEFVVYNAWRQRREAQEVVRLLRKYHQQPEPDSSVQRLMKWMSGKKVGYYLLLISLRLVHRSNTFFDSRLMLIQKKEQSEEEQSKDSSKEPWTLIHGFYFVMGGYCMDMTHDPERVWPQHTNRLTIRPTALPSLLSDWGEMSIPYLSDKEIADKSKTNRLAKGIICVQALWFCVQFFGRIAQKLPVTLLELNTFAHSICALLIYVLWWQKPLDIEEPTVIETQSSEMARKLCAEAYSQIPKLWRQHWHAVDRFGRQLSFSADELYTIMKCDEKFGNYEPGSIRGEIQGITRSTEIAQTSSDGLSFKGIDEHLPGRICISSDPLVVSLLPGERIPGTTISISGLYSSFELDEIMLARLQRLPPIKIDVRPRGGSLLAYREPNFGLSSLHESGTELGKTEIDSMQFVAITLFGLFYGGLHTLSWGSAALSSRTESLFWIVSCVTILGTGPVAILSTIILNKSTFDNRSRCLFLLYALVDGTLLHLAIFSLSLCSILYLLSRVFLLVEVFLSLTRADPAVYNTPNWSPYWPHIF